MGKLLKRLFFLILILFVVLNVMVYNHAYQAMHFTEKPGYKKQKPEDLTMSDKLKLAFTGSIISKPKNTSFPQNAYKTIKIPSKYNLEAWVIEVPKPKGVVLLFHGYRASKSIMTGYSDIINQAGYHTILVDFPGSGGSEGLETTIGYNEAYDVKRSLEVADSLFADLPKYLLGSSMGAASIMRAVAVYDIAPSGILLECPFGTMEGTLGKRFEAMNVPTFPLSNLLMFWGGWQNGFDPYTHNPQDYAKSITIPTLLMSGKVDARVTQAEIQTIFDHLKGQKELVWMNACDHQPYLTCEPEEWKSAVLGFLKKD